MLFILPDTTQKWIWNDNFSRYEMWREYLISLWELSSSRLILLCHSYFGHDKKNWLNLMHNIFFFYIQVKWIMSNVIIKMSQITYYFLLLLNRVNLTKLWVIISLNNKFAFLNTPWNKARSTVGLMALFHGVFRRKINYLKS